MAKTASGLIAYARAQLGRPYWMGTFGNTASAALYASNKKRLPQYYTAADFPRQYGQRVHDCIGLIKGYLWSDGPDSAPRYCGAACPVDHSADSMFHACQTRGGIATMPDTPGVLVFIHSTKTGRMEHIGVYIGGGQVIEARGHAYGVVQTALRGRGWTHWGLCPYITYDSANGAGSEDEMISQEEFNQMMDNWLAQRNAAYEPKWSMDAGSYGKAKAKGIMDGTRAEAFVKRDELAVVLDRLKLL